MNQIVKLRSDLMAYKSFTLDAHSNHPFEERERALIRAREHKEAIVETFKKQADCIAELEARVLAWKGPDGHFCTCENPGDGYDDCHVHGGGNRENYDAWPTVPAAYRIPMEQRILELEALARDYRAVIANQIAIIAKLEKAT